jgi:hypothetical protein
MVKVTTVHDQIDPLICFGFALETPNLCIKRRLHYRFPPVKVTLTEVFTFDWT